jgi:hypothetical protein
MSFAGGDRVSYGTLLLWGGSAFYTQAEVYSLGAAPSTGAFYQVDSLDLVTAATWRTSGTFRPSTAAGKYMRFNMSGTAPWAVMGDIQGTGTVSLSSFDPGAQQRAHLAWAGRPYWSDDPAGWDYTGAGFFDHPAFIMSDYRTKRLRMGDVTLVDSASGYATVPAAAVAYEDAGALRKHYSGASGMGELYDDFAFTSGLRRYYWDVYAQGGAGANTLNAYNYHTADASHVYAQSAAAGSVAAVQAQQASLSAIDGAARNGMADSYHLELALAGSHTRNDTGSHVDLDSWTGALALSRKVEHGMGQALFGIFGEFGAGEYESFTSVPRYGDVFGEGDVRTYGGGLFARNAFPTGTVVEATVRGGGIRNKFRLTRDPWAQWPQAHNAESDSSYLGGHVGLAQVIEITGSSEIEAYGRYFLTRTPSDSFMTASGDRISIDSFSSSRVRAGGRYTMSLPAGTLRLYLGLAAEHEFDGKVTGRNGEDPFLHSVDTSGTSGFGELGVSFTPSEAVSLSLGAFGWTGQQKGAGGNASLSFTF